MMPTEVFCKFFRFGKTDNGKKAQKKKFVLTIPANKNNHKMIKFSILFVVCLMFFSSCSFLDSMEYLNPRNREATIGYYYSKDGKKGLIEFFKGDNRLGLFLSQDGYSHRSFFSNSSGDTLYVGQFKTHYIKEIIPETW